MEEELAVLKTRYDATEDEGEKTKIDEERVRLVAQVLDRSLFTGGRNVVARDFLARYPKKVTVPFTDKQDFSGMYNPRVGFGRGRLEKMIEGVRGNKSFDLDTMLTEAALTFATGEEADPASKSVFRREGGTIKPRLRFATPGARRNFVDALRKTGELMDFTEDIRAADDAVAQVASTSGLSPEKVREARRRSVEMWDNAQNKAARAQAADLVDTYIDKADKLSFEERARLSQLSVELRNDSSAKQVSMAYAATRQRNTSLILAGKMDQVKGELALEQQFGYPTRRLKEGQTPPKKDTGSGKAPEEPSPETEA